MKTIFTSLLLVISGFTILAQQDDRKSYEFINSAQRLLATEGNLTIGGYGEVHFNQPLNTETYNNGKLDVHRMVLLFGYNFNNRTQFISEIEFEHVSEVYIEQAFLQHRLTRFMDLRGGLLLIPVGIINEYHEPTTFNGVERPLIDNVIAPTTWREIGLGISGNILPSSMRYQLYLVNGFNGYNGSARLSGKSGFRSGRQKGAESYISSPNLTGKVEYYGIRGLNLGLSGYFGDTQSTLYDGLDKTDEQAVARADSSVVGISMYGLDARYVKGALQLKGQFYYAGINNSEAYNTFTTSNGKMNDLGSAMTGYYLEAGYNVLRSAETDMELIPFVRTEAYNKHYRVEGNLPENPAYKVSAITTGLTLRLAPGAVVKTDLQLVKPDGTDEWTKTFNAGIGFMF